MSVFVCVFVKAVITALALSFCILISLSSTIDFLLKFNLTYNDSNKFTVQYL